MTAITIPKSIKSIGKWAFPSNLEAVYIADITNWCQINFYDMSSSPFTAETKLYLNETFVTELIIHNALTLFKRHFLIINRKYGFNCHFNNHNK